MARTLKVLAWSLAVCALGACNGSSPIATTSGTLSLQLEEVAVESDRMTSEIVGEELAAMGVVAASRSGAGTTAPVVEQRSFTRTRSCPGGGTFTVEGNIVRTADRETGLMEAEISGSRTRIDCMFDTSTMTITVNGSSQWEKFRRRINGIPDGPQTSHYSGSWVAVSSEGEQRSCTFDITVVRNPDERSRTIDGTICAERWRRHRGWDPESDS